MSGGFLTNGLRKGGIAISELNLYEDVLVGQLILSMSFARLKAMLWLRCKVISVDRGSMTGFGNSETR